MKLLVFVSFLTSISLAYAGTGNYELLVQSKDRRHILVVNNPSQIHPAGKFSEFNFEVQDWDQNPITTCTAASVELWMPSPTMDHGSRPTKVILKEGSSSVFVVTKVFFMMDGFWRVTAKLECIVADKKEQLEFEWPVSAK